MFENDLVRQLLHEARFAALPLLDGDGVFTGLHLHRVTPGGVVDVVQVWADDREKYHAAHARVQNTFSSDAPFAPAAALVRVSGRLGDIAGHCCYRWDNGLRRRRSSAQPSSQPLHL